jgi:hypothetical protein
VPEGSGKGIAWKGDEAGMLTVELHNAGVPNLDGHELEAAVKQALPQTILVGEAPSGTTLAHE